MKKIVLVFTLILCAWFAFGGCAKNAAQQIAEQLELGQRYLEEGDYEAAIVAFNKAIEIDPKCVQAYIGKADAYIGTEDLDAALEVLQEGYAQTSSEEIQSKIAEVEQKQREIEEEEARKAEQEQAEQEQTEPATEELPEQPEDAAGTEDAAWIRELYDALMANDFETVKNAMENESDLLAKCAPYELTDWSWWDYEEGYKLQLSETECVGVIVYRMGEDGSGEISEIDVFVGTADGQNGFEYLGAGDKGVVMRRSSDGGGITWQACDGQSYYMELGVDASASPIGSDEIWAIWHA